MLLKCKEINKAIEMTNEINAIQLKIKFAFIFPPIVLCSPPGRRAAVNTAQNKLAPNGRLPATLPEPIKRARVKDLCGFAGEGNVVERSERYASVAKPKGP